MYPFDVMSSPGSFTHVAFSMREKGLMSILLYVCVLMLVHVNARDI